MKYELTKELETGNAIIDKEHRELLEAVNTLMDACGKGQGRAALEPAVKFLLNYVDQHFAHEEQLQKQSNYPGLAAHRTFHENYKKTLREVAAAIPPAGPTIADLNNINMQVGVLVSHIKTEDKRLGAHLKQG